MTLSIVPADAGLLLVQAGCVLAPRAITPAWTARVKRFRSPGWAVVPIASIVGVIFLIQYASGTANWLTYIALIGVPIGAFLALAWLMHGPGGGGRLGGVAVWRPVLAAIITGGLFVLAWRDQYQLPGQAAATLLSALSCVTLGVLLAAVTPSGWLKAGIIAMSVADVWLIATTHLQAPNNELVAATPGGGLPQLQSETFGVMNMGYGDLFLAGVLGGVLANMAASARVAAAQASGALTPPRSWIVRTWRDIQVRGALMTLIFAGLFDLLFFVFHDLPATVPVASTLIVLQAAAFVRGRRRSRTSARQVLTNV